MENYWEERGIMFAFNEEGYANGVYQNSNSEPTYSYYRRDHLGNNREVWRAAYTIGSTNYAAATTQRIQYYPSGLPWGEAIGIGPGAQPYKYNGKEFIEEHGLDEYDSQARMYYPAIVITPTQDPHCETYPWQSPYAWCANNFVNNFDPDGRDYWSTSDKDEIERFLQALQPGGTNTPTQEFNYGEWEHGSDSEFAEGLTYNDETGVLYSSYGVVSDGEYTQVGVSAAAKNDYNGRASIQTWRGNWYNQSSGRATPQNDLFFILLGGTKAGGNLIKRIFSSNAPEDVHVNGFSYKKKSTKGSPHGDGGRAISKSDKQIADLRTELQTATGKDRIRIKNKIEKIQKNAQKQAKGETHWRR